MRPSATARNMSTAFRPGRSGMRGASQKARTAERCIGSSRSRWQASMLASPPTSRPPIALGCPVTENGPIPGRPIRPVAMWQFRMAFTLSVPAEDWFTPWLKIVTTRSCGDPEAAEPRDQTRVETGRPRVGAERPPQRVVEPVDLLQVASVERPALVDRHQEPVEQRHVGADPQRQMQVRPVAGRGAARIDDDDLRAPRGLRGKCALVQHRVAPGEVGTDEHDQVGLVDILVGARHGVGAEGPLVPRHGGRHAEARIGVDVRGPDEALHQLVGDVVILGQHLARGVEGHAVGPVLRDGPGEARGDAVERAVPARLPPLDARREEAAAQVYRLGQGGALGAEPAPVGRMVRIAPHRQPARPVRPVRVQHDAAADAAIGTGGADPLRHAADRLPTASPSRSRRPSSTRIG